MSSALSAQASQLCRAIRAENSEQYGLGEAPGPVEDKKKEPSVANW